MDERQKRRRIEQKRRKKQAKKKRLILISILILLLCIVVVGMVSCIRNIMDKNGTDAERLAKSTKTFTYKDVRGNEYTVPLLDEVPKQNYDFSRLEKKDEFYYYKNEVGEVISKVGIDVSKHQGDIDWNKVKAAGVDFAIIRLGYRGYSKGGLVLDEQYESNIKGATEAGIDVGVYFFSQAVSKKEAVEEAEYVLEHIKGYELTYPVVFDTEEQEAEGSRTSNTEGDVFTDACIAFCDRVKEAGYDPMIYYNMTWATNTLDLTKLTAYDKWYADYYEEPQSPYEFSIWQYTESGKVDGVEGTVDLNILLAE